MSHSRLSYHFFSFCARFLVSCTASRICFPFISFTALSHSPLVVLHFASIWMKWWVGFTRIMFGTQCVSSLSDENRSENPLPTARLPCVDFFHIIFNAIILVFRVFSSVYQLHRIMFDWFQLISSPEILNSTNFIIDSSSSPVTTYIISYLFHLWISH